MSHRMPSLWKFASQRTFQSFGFKACIPQSSATFSSLIQSSSSSSSTYCRRRSSFSTLPLTLNSRNITNITSKRSHPTNYAKLFPKDSLQNRFQNQSRLSSTSAQKNGTARLFGSFNNATLEQKQKISTSATSYRELFLQDKSIQSPILDIDIPKNVPFHQIIFEKCDLFKEKPALSEFLTGKSYTYAQLKDKTIRAASALAKRGYKKGDTVLVFSPNQIDFTVLMLASSCLGLKFSAANPTFTPEELAVQLNNSDSVAIFSHPFLAGVSELALRVKEYPNKIKDKFVFGQHEGYEPFGNLLEDDGKAFPDVDLNPMRDVYALPYSSGTTGLPKGVMLSHCNILANTLQISKSFKYEEDANVLGLLPLYHIYGMVVVQFGSLFNGSHLHLLPKFEPESFLKCMQEKKITNANLVPPLVLFMAKHPIVDNFDMTSMKNVICGAAPLGREITQAFATRFDVTPQQGFGLTETSPVTHIDVDIEPGSIGSLVCNTKAKIVDIETGQVLGPEQEGELCVAGPQVMLGYYKNEEATRNILDKDGWLHTGDIGYVGKHGSFFICDRLKELIKFKGSQVAPAELESLLIGHPDIADACVIGLPDDKAGELPKAFVVRKPGSDIQESSIVKYIEDQVSDIKRLRGGVEFIDEIPKNPSGKILRKKLRTA